MIDKNTIYTVKNRSASKVIYRIPELNIRREFTPGESKRITFGELEQLSYQPGGRALMAQFLQLTNEAALNQLGIKAEPEYFMSEQDIIDLLRHGTLDAFLDCLDFGNTGNIDLIKKYAISLPLADYEKKQALKKKTGFDVDKALSHIEEEKTEDAAVAASAQGGMTPGRRTSGEAYKKVVYTQPDNAASETVDVK